MCPERPTECTLGGIIHILASKFVKGAASVDYVASRMAPPYKWALTKEKEPESAYDLADFLESETVNDKAQESANVPNANHGSVAEDSAKRTIAANEIFQQQGSSKNSRTTKCSRDLEQFNVRPTSLRGSALVFKTSTRHPVRIAQGMGTDKNRALAWLL